MGVCTETRLHEPIHETPIAGDLTFNQLLFYLASGFTGVAVIVSFYLTNKHATNYTRPKEQKHIIRICLMVPIYSAAALLCIKYYGAKVYISGAYQFYETLVVASFFTLLCQYLHADLAALQRIFAVLEPRPWVYPVKLFVRLTRRYRTPPEKSDGLLWFNTIWLCVFQYCAFKLLTTVLTYITEASNTYCEESGDPDHSHIWIIIFQTFSLMAAMLSLLQFYVQCRPELDPHKPVLKFLAIKLVILVAFIQTALLNLLTGSRQIVKASDTISYQSYAAGLPNCLLCIEMAIVAVLHLFAYPSEPYHINNQRTSEAVDGDDADNERPAACGGVMGWRAYVDAFNFIDIGHSVLHGLSWLFGLRQGKGSQATVSAPPGTVEETSSEGVKTFAEALERHNSGLMSPSVTVDQVEMTMSKK